VDARLTVLSVNNSKRFIVDRRLNMARCCRFAVQQVLFYDLLSRSYVYGSVWGVLTADNFTPVKRDESFSVMFTEP